MKRKKINEDEAYRKIQKESMDRRKSIKDISDAIILADQMDITH
jgi:AmiR/NasT family two-component response regulator